MVKRLIAAVAIVAGVVLWALPAGATCIPGRVEVDPRTRTIIVEPPRCNPFE